MGLISRVDKNRLFMGTLLANLLKYLEILPRYGNLAQGIYRQLWRIWFSSLGPVHDLPVSNWLLFFDNNGSLWQYKVMDEI